MLVAFEASMWSSNIIRRLAGESGQGTRTLFFPFFYFFFLGLLLTADVRHSHVLGRQYLNVLFTPTVAFKGHTKGHMTRPMI